MKRHRSALAILIAGWLVYAGPLLDPRTNLYLTDTFCQDVPLRIYAARMIRSGTFPHWTSDVQCGFPLFSDGQTGVVYPFFALYLLWPSPEMHDIFMAVHYFLAGLFMYIFLQQRVRPAAAAAGGVTFMAGAYLQSNHVVPGCLAAACWLPLSLYLLDRHVAGSQPAKWWCAAVNAVALLAGHVHVALISYTLQAVYLWWLPRPSGSPRRYLRTAFVVFVLPLGLCAIQMLPTRHFLDVSNRSPGFLRTGLDLGQFLIYGIGWRHLVTFVLPDYLGTPWDFPLPEPRWRYTPWEEGLALFHGYAAVVLVPWAILQAKERRLVRFWLGVLVLGLLVSGANPVRMLLFFVPLHNLFRWPARYLLVVSVAISVFVALGSDDIIDRAARWFGRQRERIVEWALSAIVALLVVHRTMAPFLTEADFYTIHDPAIVETARTAPHFRLLPAARALYRYWQADEARLRANARFLPVSYNLLFDVPAATLFDQGNAVSPEEMAELVRSKNPKVLRLAAVTHISAPTRLEQLEPEEIEILQPVPLPPPEDVELISDGPSTFYRYRPAMPRAWMVYKARAIADPRRRLETVLGEDFDPATEAIVERDVGTFRRPRTPPEVAFRESRPNELHIVVNTEEQGLLVVADTYAEDFVTEIDGEATPLLRANHAFRGVVVPAGEHTVTMRIYPDAFYLGRLITALCSLLALAGLVRAIRADRHRTAISAD